LLQEKGRIFRESFLSKLALLLRGTVAAPPERFGETLADEHIRGGAFVGPDNKPVMVNEQLPNAHMRLFGGAQYHRAMAEFRAGIGTISCPDISREEIVNACGIDDFHDGVNYTRTACVIAVGSSARRRQPRSARLLAAGTLPPGVRLACRPSSSSCPSPFPSPLTSHPLPPAAGVQGAGPV
jgi:hypothetical protein